MVATALVGFFLFLTLLVSETASCYYSLQTKTSNALLSGFRGIVAMNQLRHLPLEVLPAGGRGVVLGVDIITKPPFFAELFTDELVEATKDRDDKQQHLHDDGLPELHPQVPGKHQYCHHGQRLGSRLRAHEWL